MRHSFKKRAKHPLSLAAHAKTDIGMRRTVNQDSLLCDQKNQLFIIADGLGGHNGGEVASQLAIASLSDTIPKINAATEVDFEVAFKRCIEDAGKRIFDQACTRPELHGMGTTLTAAVVRHNMLVIGQVGDSRCYLIRPPHVWQLTEDHSLVQEQVRAGVLTLEKARSHQYKNVITRCLGNEPIVSVDLFRRQLMKGDVFLLCSDGLTGHVADEEIKDIIDKNRDKWDIAIETMIQLANSRGGDDNCSVVVFSINELES